MAYLFDNNINIFIVFNNTSENTLFDSIILNQDYNCINAIIDIKGYKYMHDNISIMVSKQFKQLILSKIQHRKPVLFDIYNYLKKLIY